ncbi:MAG: ribonuclease III domain-containing protein [Verrucomicrobiota bacterium]
MKPSETEDDREWAWIGDAALAMAAREWILETQGGLNGDIHRRITSNDFLRSFGHPTKVEADLGRRYRQGGMEAVTRHFREVMVPKYREFFGSERDKE